ncbi:unnamed protein product [Rotaria magnacalcarata]|uniref:Uncharacterized protein n=1 Tax=Rotaria magnacalcarata TaxID=392030 RepID=A0A8S2TN09_9BILA|nr:unnamed protein product [Rotaria magnacalcarata]
MSEDGKSANDEKPAASNKLESMPPDELIKLFKSQVALKKKLDSKISELSTANISLCQTQEQLRNELEDEQLKTKYFVNELDQCKIHESKLQQELNTLRESSECRQLQNESLKLSCNNLQDEILVT